MKNITIVLIFSFFLFSAYSQDRYATRNGLVSFYSETSLESIKAVNNQVSCVFDIKTGDIVFQIKMVGFHFKRALMEEHFNEKYIDSEEYPKSTFIGRIHDWSPAFLDRSNTLDVSALGIIEIHGIKKEINAEGRIRFKQETIDISSEFVLTIADFNIDIPNLVKDKIAKKVQINVDVQLQRM